MSQHPEPRRGRFLRGLASRKVRAALCLGIFAAPAAVGTMAYWTDEAIIESGQFSSGTLDLTVGASVEDSSHLPGPGGEFAYSALAIVDLVPGESLARPFVVRNSGTTPFAFNGSVFTTSNDLVAAGSGLKVAIYSGGTPTNTGTQAAGNRGGTCDGGVLLKDQAVSTSTDTVEVSPEDIPVAPGATHSHCVTVSLDPASPNELQGRTTALAVKLHAKQVSNP